MKYISVQHLITFNYPLCFANERRVTVTSSQ